MLSAGYPIRRKLFLVLAALLASAAACGSMQAAEVNVPPPAENSITIHVAGVGVERPDESSLGGLLIRLENDYRKDHASIRFVHTPSGNDSALGVVYVGAADMAFMDRDPSYVELDGYQQAITGETPVTEQVVRGGLAASGRVSPLVVVVNRDNPLKSLSVAQLKAIFMSDTNFQTDHTSVWGDVNLGGIWSLQPLHIYGFAVATDEATQFSNAVLGGSTRWACSYREITGKIMEQVARSISDLVAKDRSAIGITTLAGVSAGAKIVAISNERTTPALPTNETLANGRYTLGRTVLAISRRHYEGSIDAQIKSFMAYLVSPRAAAIIALDGNYVPVQQPEIDWKEKSHP